MKPNRRECIDKRINARRPFWKEFLIIFTVVFLFSLTRDIILNQRVVRNLDMHKMILIKAINMFALALVVSIIARTIRYIAFTKPMMELGKAAQNVATGDFTVQVNTQRKDNKKDELEVLIDDFNKMVRELATIETMKEDFIANISHEIKTPLSIIKSYAVSLRNPKLNEAEKEAYIDTIVEASERLSNLVSDVLRLNKLENLEITRLEKYSLDEQLRLCILNFEDKFEEKEIQLEIELDEIYISSDKSLLEIVWNNLITNALKFTESKGTVKLSAYTEEAFAVVKISDTGCGMKEETIRHMFDRFYQGDTSHHVEGNGLGLSIVKRILDILSIDINVESKYNEGTEFTIKISL